jgi:acyl carrier protein
VTSGVEPSIRERLAALVASVCVPPADPGRLTDDTKLIGEGLALDSLALLEVVVGLESEFGLAVPGTDVTSANFGTLGRLCAFVGARTGR